MATETKLLKVRFLYRRIFLLKKKEKLRAKNISLWDDGVICNQHKKFYFSSK